MHGIRTLIGDGTLEITDFDGRQFGHNDSEDGLPNMKPMRVYTAMGALVDAVDGVFCKACPRREQLKGQN